MEKNYNKHCLIGMEKNRRPIHRGQKFTGAMDILEEIHKLNVLKPAMAYCILVLDLL